MSKNVEVLKQGYENFRKGDIPAVLAVFDPKIEWTEPKGSLYGGTYVGHDAIVENVFAKVGSEWDNFEVAPHEFIDGGDRIVVLGKFSGTYKASGKSFEADFAHVWSMKDGIATKQVVYTDTALMQEALK